MRNLLAPDELTSISRLVKDQRLNHLKEYIQSHVDGDASPPIAYFDDVYNKVRSKRELSTFEDKHNNLIRKLQLRRQWSEKRRRDAGKRAKERMPNSLTKQISEEEQTLLSSVFSWMGGTSPQKSPMVKGRKRNELTHGVENLEEEKEEQSDDDKLLEDAEGFRSEPVSLRSFLHDPDLHELAATMGLHFAAIVKSKSGSPEHVKCIMKHWART